MIHRTRHDWISCEERLPEMNERVEVKGADTPEGNGWPISYRRHAMLDWPGTWRWESTEWRGEVGVTHWRPIARCRFHVEHPAEHQHDHDKLTEGLRAHCAGCERDAQDFSDRRARKATTAAAFWLFNPMLELGAIEAYHTAVGVAEKEQPSAEDLQVRSMGRGYGDESAELSDEHDTEQVCNVD